MAPIRRQRNCNGFVLVILQRYVLGSLVVGMTVAEIKFQSARDAKAFCDVLCSAFGSDMDVRDINGVAQILNAKTPTFISDSQGSDADLDPDVRVW